MKIIQISDSHIGHWTDATSGIDVRRNFEFILKKIESEKPSFIIHSGDICFDIPEISIYKWVKEKLDSIHIPYSLIAGNHDDTSMICQIFDQKHQNKECYFDKIIENKKLLFLDTANGDMSETQYDWLTDQLSQSEINAIFMHHPPIKMGVPFMDQNYSFKSMEKFCSIIEQYSKPIQIFCGHYHNARSVTRKNMQVHICPSTFYELNDFSDKFGMSSDRIGYRIIEIDDQNYVKTTLKYFNGFTNPLIA